MGTINSLLQHPYASYVGVGVIVLISVPVVKRILCGRQHEQRKIDISKYPRDKVTLFQFPRAPYAPSYSPFSLKLETYLRMANIPYQNQHGWIPSSKQKIPFIVYQGEEVADSQFSIQHLNRVRGVDLNSWLTDEQRAVARAFQMMTEDHLFWVFEMVFFGWYGVSEADGRVFWELAFEGMPFNAIRAISQKILANAYAQGMGRHTEKEVFNLGEGDIRAISNFLGKKAFLFGDQPCEEDCAVFSLLAQFYWHVPGPIGELMKGECRNLGDYCGRMKDRFWPDWDECITHGGTREATK